MFRCFLLDGFRFYISINVENQLKETTVVHSRKPTWAIENGS